LKNIKFVDLFAGNKHLLTEFLNSARAVFQSGNYILGDCVDRFERNVKTFLNAKHFVSCANGTDALILSLKCCGVKPGDEVLVTPMSYLASVSCVKIVGANPVFCDVDEKCNINPKSIINKINKKTKAIIVVHLGGIPAQIKAILKVLKEHKGIYVIEDCAQAFGSYVENRHVGTFGDFGCFSFHPLKTLGGLGDGGGIIVKSISHYRYLMRARNHGHIDRNDCSFFSQNSRLDEIQAAFLTRLLKEIKFRLKQRRKQVYMYLEYMQELVNNGKIVPILPYRKSISSFNFFMIMTLKRDELKTYLSRRGIDCRVHYPILLNKLSAFNGQMKNLPLPNAQANVRKILSLPLGRHIRRDDIKRISFDTIKLLKKQ